MLKKQTQGARSRLGRALLAGGVAAMCTLSTSTAEAAPYVLTEADRGELVSLATRLVEALRDGARSPTGVFPTAAEIRGLYPSGRDAEAVVQGHLAAIERDVRALRPSFAGAQFVGLSAGRTAITSGPDAGAVSIDLRPCSRLARADSQCGNAVVLVYAAAGASRRLRIDAVTRVGGHWRVLDLR